MQVNRAPASAGWQWVVQGFRLLRRRPLPLVGLMVLFFFSIAVPTILPVIGQFASLALMPALSLGFVQAVRAVDAGRIPTPWSLYDGLRARGGRGAVPLLQLGAANCVLTVGALAASTLADGGALFRFFNGALPADDPALADTSFAFAALVFMTLYVPVQMAMWYSPMFVAWHGVPPGKALFYSWISVWRNRAAFVVYGLGWLGVAAAMSIGLRLVGTLVPAPVLPLLLSMMSLVLLAAVYCSFWPTWRDVVREGPAGVADPGPIGPA